LMPRRRAFLARRPTRDHTPAGQLLRRWARCRAALCGRLFHPKEGPVNATPARIDAWLKENTPLALGNLQPPGTPEAPAGLERGLGFPVPAELRNWLSVHDGQPPDSLLGMLDGWIFLGAEQIATAHRTFTDLLNAGEFEGQPTRSRDGLAEAVWWSAGGVPFLEGPGGDYLVIDTDPTESGEPGQGGTFWHA